jgi:hypothetical protein
MASTWPPEVATLQNNDLHVFTLPALKSCRSRDIRPERRRLSAKIGAPHGSGAGEFLASECPADHRLEKGEFFE